MHLLVESELKAAGGIVGAGFDEFRWPRPVRPSKSLPNQGLIKVRTTPLNQNNEAVQIQIGNLIVPRRQSGEVG
jgi:acyl dehydratase